MSSFDWKGVLGKVAPWIATTLGGPAAGIGVKALCDICGLEPTVDNAQKVAQMVQNGQMTADQFAALQTAEQHHQETMQAMGYKQITDLEDIAFKDRADARAREIAVKDKTPMFLAYGIVLIWGAVNLYLMRHAMGGAGLPPDMIVIVAGVQRTMDAGLVFVLGYYFGSSAGSSRKDDLLQQSKPADKP